MLGEQVQSIQRGGVTVRLLRAEGLAELSCARHQLLVHLPLDGAAFGRDFVSFLRDHEPCSEGCAPVIDVTEG